MSAINSKNDELNENLKKFDKLNQYLMEYETKIKYYMVKAQMFVMIILKLVGIRKKTKKRSKDLTMKLRIILKKKSLNKKKAN